MKKRILVVEKNEDILEVIDHILTDEGYEVKLSLTEKNIFDQIINYQPDAILLDIVVPTKEGTELCRNIKEAETTKHIPVIVLSTHNKAATIKDVCADEVINKPFDISLLLDTLKNTLSETYS